MNSSIEAVIKSRREDALLRRDTLSLIFRVIFIAAVAYLLFAKVFLITQMKGNDMFPALKDGDLIIAFRLQQDYVKNDIAVFETGGAQHVGRAIALDSDVVALNDSGTLIINGTVQGGEIFYPTYAGEGIDYPFRVPQNSMFFLGDNRTKAVDSRSFGPVPMEHVKGKVITILRRRGL